MRRLALAAMLGTLATACATPPLPREVSDAVDGARITLLPGQELIVNLDGNLGTGFRWNLTRNAEPVLKQVGEPTTQQRAAESRLAGAGGVTTFKFRAAAPGYAALTFSYRRPWETNIPPAKSVHFDIRVE